MSKRQTSVIILFTVILTFLLNIFVGRYMATQLSVLPFLNKFKILNPETPIVITQRQEIRTSDSGDVFTAIDGAKSKVSLLLSVSGQDLKVVGGAINATSDGWFITSKAAVGNAKPADLRIKLDNGDILPVSRLVSDPATGILFVQATGKSVPAARFGESSRLRSGEKLVFVLTSLFDHEVSSSVQYVTRTQNDTFHAVLNSNLPSRGYAVSDMTSLILGQAAVSMTGDVMGLADGTSVISSDVLKNAVDRFLSSGAAIQRPDFGFSYRMVVASEHSVTNLPEGAMVQKGPAENAASSTPAQKAGLLENDVITSINGSVVNEDNTLEEVLQQFKPGDTLKLAVTRGSQIINLQLVPGSLK